MESGDSVVGLIVEYSRVNAPRRGASNKLSRLAVGLALTTGKLLRFMRQGRETRYGRRQALPLGVRRAGEFLYRIAPKARVRLPTLRAARATTIMEQRPPAVIWYREDEYERLRHLFEGSADFRGTYAAWLQRAEIELQLLRDGGIPVVKVEFDLDEFLAWCQTKGRGVSRDTLFYYATHKLTLMLKNERGSDSQERES